MKKKNTLALSLVSLMLITGCKNNSDSTSKNSLPSNSKITNNSTTNSDKKTDSTTTSTSTKKEAYAITVNATGVTLNGIPKEAKEGEVISFTATLDAEKVLSYITIDGENVLEADQNGNFSFTMPKRAVTVEAVTADKRYNINVTQVDGATLSVSTTSAKKDEIVKVRVTIGDSKKKSPIVKADDTEVTMTVVEDSYNTFIGEFKNIGKDMAVTLSLTDAAVKHAITDKGGDGAIVSGPTAAVEGETVTFRIGLEEGFEFDGDVVVTKDGKTGEEANVEVTKNDDGTYSFVMPDCAVTITRNTTASIYKINTTIVNSEDIDGDKITSRDVSVTEYAVYKSTVAVEITSNNYYTVAKVEANGVEATLNTTTGKYEFEMPSCKVELKITTKAQRYVLNVNNSSHVTLEAYVKDNDTYTKAPVDGVTYGTQVYIKSTISDENYGIKSITVQYSSSSYSTQTLTLNEDGYYTDSYYCTPNSMNYLKLDFTVVECEKLLEESDSLYGQHTGFTINSSSTYSYELNEFGLGKYGSGSYPSDVTLNNFDKTSNAFELKTNGSYSSTYYGKVLDDITSYVYDYSSAYNADNISILYYVALFLKGSSLTTKEYLADNSSSYSATKYIAHLANENGDRYVLVDKNASVKVSLVTVNFINDATSIKTSGALFEVKNGETTTYYKNANNILTSFTKGEEGTFSGKLGETNAEITSDGISKLTIKEGETSTDISFSSNGKLVYFTYNSKKYYITFDSATKTFSKVNFGTGSFYGKTLSTSSSGRYISIKDDFTGYAGSYYQSYATYSGLSYDNDGMFNIGTSDKFVFSPDGKTIVGKYYSDPMILSSKFYSTSLNGKYLKNKTDNFFVSSLYKDATDNVSVYFDGTDYKFGTIDEPSKIENAGEYFIFTDSSDNKKYYLRNNANSLEVEDTSYFDVEYSNSEFGTLTLKNDGTGTIKKDETTTDITYTKKKGSYFINLDGKKYTVAFNNDDKTYTCTEYIVQIPEWLAGKTYKGTVIGSTNTTCYFVFDAKKATLSCSAGTGATDSTPLAGRNCNFKDVAYDIEDDKLTFTLEEEALTLVLNDEDKTFQFENDSKDQIDGITFRSGKMYTYTVVTTA